MTEQTPDEQRRDRLRPFTLAELMDMKRRMNASFDAEIKARLAAGETVHDKRRPVSGRKL